MSTRDRVAELVLGGMSHAQAFAATYPRVRMDEAEVAVNAHHRAAMHAIMVAQKMGTRRPVQKMPSQNYPRAMEADYGSRIVALVHRARRAFDPLVKELPAMLERARASRGDSSERNDSELTDTLAAFAGSNQSLTFAGFQIVVENQVGSTRSWVDGDGTKGWTFMKYRYGYIAGAIGADGEEVDVYLGPNEDSPWVYVVHQQKISSGFIDYDEDKVMLGWPTADAARLAYASQYNDPRFFGGMTTMSVADFRAALAATSGDKITHRADGPADPDAPILHAKRLVDAAERQMENELTPAEIEKLATFFARQTSQAQRKELARQLSAALGIDVIPDEKYIPAMLDYFTHENATLIGSIPSQLHQEVANLTARAFTKRMHPDTFASLLEDRFSVAESRARFIARDQLGKLWGQLNAVRQRGVGIQHFFWETQGDTVVRPSHRRMQGKRVSFDDPPSFGLPGEDFACRCMARPDVSGILAGASSITRGESLPSVY